MRRTVATAAVLVLVACNQAHQPPENQATATEKVTAEANTNGGGPQTAPNEAAASSKALPPTNAALRFVGTWAATQQECASKPWRFTAAALKVEGGPQCSFYKVSTAPGGYNVAATCPTKTPVQADLIRLRFAESAQAMLVESNAIPPTGLVYCGK